MAIESLLRVTFTHSVRPHRASSEQWRFNRLLHSYWLHYPPRCPQPWQINFVVFFTPATVAQTARFVHFDDALIPLKIP